MEERMDCVTDKQWDGVIKMAMMLAMKSETALEVYDSLKILLREEDAEEVDRKIKKLVHK